MAADRDRLARTASLIARPLAVIAAAMMPILAAGAAAIGGQPASKPKVPVGVDPGGFAVAVVGEGIDYWRPEIARRLARDGEGEIIGFDLVDGDRLPYAATPADVCPDDALLDLAGEPPLLRKPTPPPGAENAGAPPSQAAPGAGRCQPRPLAQTLASGRGLASRLRVAVFRVTPNDARKTAEALAMISRSPARIAVLQYPVPPELLREASTRVPDVLILAPRPAEGAYSADVCGLNNVVSLGCHPADKDWNSEGMALVAANRAQRLGTWSANAVKSWFAGSRDLNAPTR